MPAASSSRIAETITTTERMDRVSVEPQTMPTGLPAAEPQVAKMLHQDLCLNLLFPTNPSISRKPFMDLFGGDLCSYRAYYTITANT